MTATMNRLGNSNAAMKADSSRPSWADWSGSRAGKYVRFIQEYCIVPKGHGAGRPMELAPFQIEAIEELTAEGVRTGEFSLARGNGKSSFIAALGLAHVCIEEWSPQVPLIATTLRQVETATYQVAVSMANKSPAISPRILSHKAVGNKRLIVPWNEGVMMPLSADVDGLQGLDPSMAIVDEVGFVSVDSWEALRLAGGKRPESLVLGIGTTGLRTSALYRMHTLHRDHVETPGHVRINYSAPDGCDIRDRAAWRAANPALDAGFLAEDALVADVEASPESAFRAFRLNQWVDLVGKESWLGPNAERTWGALADHGYVWDASQPCFAGVDVSLKHDTTAVVAVQQRPDGRWHARAQIWRADPVVDQHAVMQAVRQLPNLAACAYDPRFWELPAQQLSEEGLLMIEVPQTPQRMVPAIGNLYRQITGGQLTHDGAPDFAAQVCNAVPRHGENGLTLSKLRSDTKIDSCIALALALSLANSPAPTEQPLTDEMLRIY